MAMTRKEIDQRYNERHPGRRAEISKKYRASHPGVVAAYNKKYRAENPDFIRELKRKHYRENTDAINEHRREHLKEKFSMSSEYEKRYRLKLRMANAINKSLKGKKNGASWEALVGYTLNDLIRHLEKQFQSGMTWKNRGMDGWHIDHKIPISVFNISLPNDIDFKKCWALSNLQPMWAKENLEKRAKIDRPFQPSLAMAIE